MILSVNSNPLSFRIFWTRFTSSLALPSLTKIGVTFTSRATVRASLLATIQPGISSLEISTSCVCNITGSLSINNEIEPSFSSRAISSCDISPIAAATAFIFGPIFFPSATKFGLIFFFIKLLSFSRYSISFTLTSDLINSSTRETCCFISQLLTGIKIRCSGCLTFILTFFLNDNTRDEISWASCILSSSDLSIAFSFTSGYNIWWTDSALCRPVILFRFWNTLSLKNGAIGAINPATTSRHSYKVW